MAAEHLLYRGVAGWMPAPAARSAAMALRTRAVDAELATAIGRGVDQIVLVGGGYDGRPLRFGGGLTRWYEIEGAETLADKRRRMASIDARWDRCTDVPLDLSGADVGAALAAAGHDADRPMLCLCEELAYRFPLEVVARVLGSLYEHAAPGSTLVAGFPVAQPASRAGRALRALSDRLPPALAAPGIAPYLPGDPEKLMVVTGWRVTRSSWSESSFWDVGARTEVVVAGAG